MYIYTTCLHILIQNLHYRCKIISNYYFLIDFYFYPPTNLSNSTLHWVWCIAFELTQRGVSKSQYIYNSSGKSIIKRNNPPNFYICATRSNVWSYIRMLSQTIKSLVWHRWFNFLGDLSTWRCFEGCHTWRLNIKNTTWDCIDTLSVLLVTCCLQS